MGNCLGSNSFCNRNQTRNRSRTQDVGVCVSSSTVMNQQQAQTAITTSSPTQQVTSTAHDQTNNTVINQISSNNSDTSTNNNSSNAWPANTSNNNNVNSVISNHISSYNLYPYYVPPATGKNKRLKKDFYKYFKFDKKITEKQLQAKRDEFWDTAPAFDGKTEIWQALKAAVDACEIRNYQLAQAIIDSANIILPNGLLNDCYDELGNRYEIPIYVLAKPSNLVKSNSTSSKRFSENEISIDDDDSSNANNKRKNNTDCDDYEDDDDDDNNDSNSDLEDDYDDNSNSDEEDGEDEILSQPKDSDEMGDSGGNKKNSKKKIQNHDLDKKNEKSNKTKTLFSSSKSKLNHIKIKLNENGKKDGDSKKLKNTSNKLNMSTTTSKEEINNELSINQYTNPKSSNKKKPTAAKSIPLKLRVSALHNEHEDIKLQVNLNQSVLSLKQALHEYIGVETSKQRMYFGGKQLKDRERLKVHKLRKNVVIQVITKNTDDSLVQLHLQNYLKQKESLESNQLVEKVNRNDEEINANNNNNNNIINSDCLPVIESDNKVNEQIVITQSS